MFPPVPRPRSRRPAEGASSGSPWGDRRPSVSGSPRGIDGRRHRCRDLRGGGLGGRRLGDRHGRGLGDLCAGRWFSSGLGRDNITARSQRQGRSVVRQMPRAHPGADEERDRMRKDVARRGVQYPLTQDVVTVDEAHGEAMRAGMHDQSPAGWADRQLLGLERRLQPGGQLTRRAGVDRELNGRSSGERQREKNQHAGSPTLPEKERSGAGSGGHFIHRAEAGAGATTSPHARRSSAIRSSPASSP